MNKILCELKQVRSSLLVRNTAWMFFGQGLSITFQGMYFVFLAQLLGSFEYGVYVGAVAFVSILSQYGSMGSFYVLLRYVSQDTKVFAAYWGNVLITTITVGTLMVAILTWGGPHWAHAYSWQMILYVSIGDCLCVQFMMAAGRVFQAFEKLHMTALLNLLINFFRMLFAVILLRYLHHGTAQQWALSALLVSLIAVCLSLILVTRFYGKPSFSFKLMFDRAGEGFVFALSASTSNIYNDFDKAMLGHYGMNAANGVYAIAYKAIDACMIPISSIHNAASPRFFQKGTDGIQCTGAYALKVLKRTAPIGILLSVFMFLAAPIIPHLAGKGFAESVQALRWLCLLPFFRSFQLSAGDALTGAGYQKIRFCAQAVTAAFNFGVNLYLIPHYGWIGAAWASLASDAILGVFNWIALTAIQGGVGNEQ